ncbi:hypothetical protein ORJ04_03510 [Rheinheimera baltica]|uniref:Uncharacterized protein n=1 Tax=Rheinheimera baltica TaxID=67576 RepID=A0ABT9HV60_9GAMM|nr:hypothetical protein [Rheinheimera baltica]MDP5135014.1 hypothetical protein [Rheinheimera baltica]
MSSISQPKDIFNCIKAPFDPVDKSIPAEWSICYGMQQNQLQLTVQIKQLELLNAGSDLVSTINADGLNEMIEFLGQVKMRMQKTG